jgi:4-hydroxybenzoate polyprenyltransferase
MKLTQHLTLYLRLMRLDRPIGILLLLWPTLWAIWIASNGRPPLLILLIFVAGTALMRSAGCVINDYADRDIDKHVKRTQQRPITSGQVTPREALWLAAALAVIAFLLILPLNTLTLLLSVPAVLLAGSYPYTKRFLAIPQAYLGIAFGFGIPMAFAAIQGSVPAVAWWMLLANIFWCIAYDTEYAMVDRDDDIHLGIHSSALFFGKYDVAAVMACYAIALAILAYAGYKLNLGIAYYAGLLLATAIAAYHYTLIRAKTASRHSCTTTGWGRQCLAAWR